MQGFLLAAGPGPGVNMLELSGLAGSSFTADTHHESMAWFMCRARIICCKPSRSF